MDVGSKVVVRKREMLKGQAGQLKQMTHQKSAKSVGITTGAFLQNVLLVMPICKNFTNLHIISFFFVFFEGGRKSFLKR